MVKKTQKMIEFYRIDGATTAEFTEDMPRKIGKVQYFITIKNEYYNEFTFQDKKIAKEFFELLKKSSIFSDNLLVSVGKIPLKSDIIEKYSKNIIDIPLKKCKSGDLLGELKW